MSAKPETNFTSRVHKYLPKTIYHMKNNNPYLSGVADVWYSGRSGDLWVEYKFIAIPKRDDTVINLVQGKTPAISRLQQAWLEGRFNEGRQVAVILGSKEGGVWFLDLHWQHGFTAREMRSWLMPPQRVALEIQNLVDHQ